VLDSVLGREKVPLARAPDRERLDLNSPTTKLRDLPLDERVRDRGVVSDEVRQAYPVRIDVAAL
jgi:hypothetical protein